MDIDIEDIMLRKDYNLKIMWHPQCEKCGGKYLRLLMHRTNDEVKKEVNPIKQICSVNMCRHVHYAWRQCTKCKTPYDSWVSECINCEEVMRHRTKLEKGVERDLEQFITITRLPDSDKFKYQEDMRVLRYRIAIAIKELQEMGYYTKEEDYKDWPEGKIKPQDIRRV